MYAFPLLKRRKQVVIPKVLVLVAFCEHRRQAIQQMNTAREHSSYHCIVHKDVMVHTCTVADKCYVVNLFLIAWHVHRWKNEYC